MFEKIKQWFFYRDFKKNARSQAQEQRGINPLQSICILFDGTSEDERKIVHKFKKSISGDNGREIRSLAFIDNALPLDNIDYNAYNLKNITWTGKPFGEKIEEFINYKFDLMIILTKKMLPHFEYIVAHAQSKFLIGPSIDHAEKYFNITVDSAENETTDDQLKKIIKAINKIAIK